MTNVETMKPGSTDTETVNLFIGSVSFPVSLVSLPGRNGLDFHLSINYSSGGIRQIVNTWNVEVSTGVLGLGWSFPQDKVVRTSNGTTLESAYYLFSGNNVYSLFKTGVDEEGDIYELENYLFWKIRYVPARELWVVTKEDGTRHFYGGGVHQTEEKTNTSTGNSIEWSVRWGHWIGPSNAVEGQEQFPVAWNLVCIENIWGDRITFTYEQDQQFVGTAGIARKKYTQACRLSQVIGATGEKVVFHYGPERGTENPYEKRQKWHTLPGGGSDAYQDRLELHFLDSLKVFNAKGDLLSQVQFRYASLGTGEMQKQILKAITYTNSQGQPYAASQLFEYYGENSADGVSVSRTDSSKLAAGGALFGALKSIISPKGATISYQYAEISLPHARRDMEIPRPSGEWLRPRTYFGFGYVVVIWRGTGSKLGKLHVSAYQWSGRWISAVGLAEVTIRDARGIVPAENNYVLDDSIQVELSADFFAIVTPGQGQSLHLFSKNHLNSGKWIYAPQNTGSITDFLIASGANFLVLLDKSTGRLHCYTQDGESWRSDPVFEQPLKTGAGTVFGLTARNNYVFTLSAVPDNAFKPEIRLYHLDQSHAWQRTIQSNDGDFFPRQGSIVGSRTISGHIGVAKSVPLVSKGVETMTLQGSNTFAVLQVSQGVNLEGVQTDSYHNYKHVVYTWTDDYATIKANALGQEIEISSNSAPADPQLIVAGNMVIISSKEAGKKWVYHYLGSQWIQRDFANDSLQNNYVGSNSFSTTLNGLAEFWEFNPNNSQWENGKIPAYKDGNPTFGSKLWSEIWPVVSFVVGILTLPLSFGVGLMIDVALLSIDLLSSRMPPEAGGAGWGGERFFTGANRVYYQDAEGNWHKIGELLSDEAQKYRLVQSVSPSFTYEQQQLEFQNTQAASNFIAYFITSIRETSKPSGGFSEHGEQQTYVTTNDPGFPKHISKVQLLKNGAFFTPARDLAEGESLKRSPDDETSLVGWNAFLTFQGGATLKEATSLKLYRIIQDDFQGPLKDYVVSQVTVHDGYEETHTHYAYEATSAEFSPMGTTAMYNQVTTVYSGASKTPDKSNGYTESYFYVGDASSLPNQPTDPIFTNTSLFPSLITGFPYFTKVCDGNDNQVAATTQSWYVFQKNLTGQQKGYYARLLKTRFSISSGGERVVEQIYPQPDEPGNGLPVKTVTYNYDVAGREEKLETSSIYGWRMYPQLRERHILAAVVESTTRINNIVTGASATTWQATPLAPFRLTPGRDLPPEFQGDGWSVTALETISARDRDQRPFPPGTSQQPWKADISPLILTANLSGTLLFTYDCKVTVGSGWTWMQLEVWVDGQKVWDVAREQGNQSTFTDAVKIALPSRHGLVEWRANCGAHVLANETGHLVNHAEVAISIRDIRFLLLAPVETYRAKNAMAVVGDPARAIVMGEQDVDMLPSALASAQQEAQAAWLKNSTIVARNPTYGVVTGTRDVDGVIHSILYDKDYRFPVARFIHASVEGHEAGYYGFEDYENEGLWQLTGTPDADDSSHTGTRARSGKDIRIEPRAFTPRAPATSYIASAWLKLRSGGNGGQIGFGKDFKQISPGDGDWQYVEYVTRTPVADQKPFARCDGVIDDFRFGPVDAPFSAAVYDPIYHLTTEQLGTNGETIRSFYDDLQSLIATTGVDGKEVIGLITEKDSRDGEKPFNVEQPNQKLSIAPRNGGQYYRTLPTPIGRGDRYEHLFHPSTANYPIIVVTPSGQLPDAVEGQPYSVQLSASGGIAPYTFPNIDLGNGLSLNSNGLVSGTPRGGIGNASRTVTGWVTNANGSTGPAFSFGIVVRPAPIVVTPNGRLPDAVEGQPYSVQLSASGGIAPYTFPNIDLGNGLSLNSNGLVSGTPRSGTGNASCNAAGFVTDANGSAVPAISFGIVVRPAPIVVIPNGRLPDAVEGQPYSVQLSASGGNYGIKFKVSYFENVIGDNENVLAPPFFGIQFGDAILKKDTSGMSLSRQGQPIKHFTAEYNHFAWVEWILIVLEKKALFFLDGKFLFCETFNSSIAGSLTVFWGPTGSTVYFTDIFLLSDPIVELLYTDGLGRVIQTQRLDDQTAGIIARQILYDGWGHPAVTTKPIRDDEITFAYRRDLVKTFDWGSGKMTGKVADYYTQTSAQASGQKPDNSLYPYSRQVAEASPLARIIEAGAPGVEFKVGSPQAVQTDFGQTSEATALLTDLHLTDKAGHYTSVTTRYPFNHQTHSVSTRLFDLQGKLVAQRQGIGSTALTSMQQVTYETDGTSSLTATQPNSYAPPDGQKQNHYLTTTKTDFQGNTRMSTDCDSGTKQYIYDAVGRLRFKLDADGVAESPNRIVYWNYDALGRILEEGVVFQAWNAEQFQRYADTEASRFTPAMEISGAGIGGYPENHLETLLCV